MYLVKNISTNRGIVCTLKDGSTLRLLPKQQETLKDNQVTDHLLNMSKTKNSLIILTYSSDQRQGKKTPEKVEGKKEV